MTNLPTPSALAAFDPDWWANAWWEQSLYQEESKLTLEDIRGRIESLKMLFDREWAEFALGVGPPNVALAILNGGQGLWPFQNLMWLGKIAKAVAPLPGVRLPTKDLCSEKTWSALFELEVASWFAELGWQTEFLKPSNEKKTPDLKLELAGVVTAIECKRFGSEQWEEWAENLTWTLLRQRQGYESSNGPCVDVIYDPRLTDIFWGEVGTREAVRDELAERIGLAVREATQSDPPRSVRIPGIAEVRLRPDLEGYGIHGVGGIQVSPQAKVRRMIVNGVLEAAKQLEEFGTGAVMIKSDLTPPQNLVEVALSGLNRAEPSALRSVGIAVFAGSDGGGAGVWRNPLAFNQRAAELLESAFAEILTIRTSA